MRRIGRGSGHARQVETRLQYAAAAADAADADDDDGDDGDDDAFKPM